MLGTVLHCFISTCSTMKDFSTGGEMLRHVLAAHSVTYLGGSGHALPAYDDGAGMGAFMLAII